VALGGFLRGLPRVRGAGPDVEGGDGMVAPRRCMVPSHSLAWARVCCAESVADTGGATVSLPCHGARTGEAQVQGDAGKGGAAVMQARAQCFRYLVAGWKRKRRGGTAGVEGKADKRAPLVSCSGGR
jgi:hypothetical protein